jgi:Fe-S-cluster-containing hydrogenase component 2
MPLDSLHEEAGAGTFSVDWEQIERLRSRTYKSLPGCRECVFRTNCSGYCLVRAARKNGTVMSVDQESCVTIKSVLQSHFLRMADDAEPEKVGA